MVYIGSDGRVLDKQPWGWNWFVGCIIGVYTVAVAFFTTLISPLTELFSGNNNSGGNGNRRGGGWGSGSGGGGNGWGGGGGGGNNGRGPGGPQRRIGRVTTISDCTIPGGG